MDEDAAVADVAAAAAVSGSPAVDEHAVDVEDYCVAIDELARVVVNCQLRSSMSGVLI